MAIQDVLDIIASVQSKQEQDHNFRRICDAVYTRVCAVSQPLQDLISAEGSTQSQEHFPQLCVTLKQIGEFFHRLISSEPTTAESIPQIPDLCKRLAEYSDSMNLGIGSSLLIDLQEFLVDSEADIREYIHGLFVKMDGLRPDDDRATFILKEIEMVHDALWRLRSHQYTQMLQTMDTDISAELVSILSSMGTGCTERETQIAVKRVCELLAEAKNDALKLDAVCVALACMTHYPGVRRQLASQHVAAQLCVALEEHKESPTTVAHGCSALAELAWDDEAYDDLMSNDVNVFLVTVMNTHRDHVGAQRSACNLILAIAIHSVTSAASLIPHVVAAINNHVSDVQLQINACYALWRAGINCADNQVAVISSFGCERVINAVKTHITNPILVLVGCALLAQLSATNNTGRTRIMNNGGIPTLLSCIQADSGEPRVLVYALTVLRNLAAMKGGVQKLMAFDIVDIIFGAMTTPATHRIGCSLLRELAENENVAVVLVEAKVIDLLIRVIQANSLESAVICNAYSTLARLVKGNPQAKQIAQAAVEPALSSLHSLFSDRDVAEVVADFLSLICSSNDVAVEEFSENNGVVEIINAMCNHPDNTCVMYSGCRLLCAYDTLYLLSDFSSQPLIAEGFARSFMSATEAQHDSKLKMELIRVLSALCRGNEANQKVFGEAGVISQLLQEMRSSDADIQFQQACMSALKLLCGYGENRLALAADGGLRTLLTVQERHSSSNLLLLTLQELLKTFTVTLTKRGHLVKNWKKRFFVFEDQRLCYYRNEEDIGRTNPQDKIAYSTISSVQESSTFDKPYLLELHADRLYYMSAEDADTRRLFIETIRSITGISA